MGWRIYKPLASAQALSMSNKASAGCLSAPHETPLATSVLCCKLLPDLPGLWPSLSSRLGQSGSNDWERHCFSRGFWEIGLGIRKHGLHRAGTPSGSLIWAGRGEVTETIGAIVSSPRKLCFTLLSGKLTLGAVGVCSKAAASCDYVGRLGQSHPSFLISHAAGSSITVGGSVP